jgi:predicted AAA+ superfamily ATPase
MQKARIIDILNSWNFWKKPKYTGVQRPSYIARMTDLAKTGQVVSITGVRRAGKSTLMLQYIKSLLDRGIPSEATLYVNFEDPRWGDELSAGLLQEIMEAHSEYLSPKEPVHLFLDEVQNVPGWERFVRSFHERREGVVFVTGSSSKLLSAELGGVLTGRRVEMVVWPLSFDEYLLFKGMEIVKPLDLIASKTQVRRHLRDYIEWGGFPHVVLKEDKREILTTYFDDVIGRDIIARYNLRKPDKLKSLARYYLTNIGSPASFNSVRKFLSIPLDTVERFSYYLTYPYLIFFVKKFSYSLKEQEVNLKKPYCVDTGLRNIISFKFSEDIGKLYENTVYMQFVRGGAEIYYWKNKSECDFLIRNGNSGLKAVQVCYLLQKENKDREIRGLLDAMEKFKIGEGMLITDDDEGIEIVGGKKINYVPLWKFLCVPTA